MFELITLCQLNVDLKSKTMINGHFSNLYGDKFLPISKKCKD